MKRGGINELRAACFEAFARGDVVMGRELEAEHVRRIGEARKLNKPSSPAAKARRRAFANLYGRNG